ncbi:MAG: (2Fe-2S)-binding protein [Thermaerobacter sp.]|nr:(2Fe-2S)-binding protein [Thermaerobacter sp.]
MMDPSNNHHAVTLTVNGQTRTESLPPNLLLSEYLRDHLRLTGTHVGCDTSQCGACTVLVDGAAVKSCTVLVVQLPGTTIETVEGLGRPDQLHPVQEAFREAHALQCGFCTPGVLMTAVALLNGDPHPTDAEIRRGLDGIICRCTGYENIVAAVTRAGNGMAAAQEVG